MLRATLARARWVLREVVSGSMATTIILVLPRLDTP